MAELTFVAPNPYRIAVCNAGGRPVGAAVRDAYGWAVMTRKPGVSFGRVCWVTRTVARVDTPLPGLSLAESARQVLAEVVAGLQPNPA